MKNKAIITTKFVVKEKYPIVKVIHHEDGDWQFLGDQDITEKDAMVLSMEQIIKLDHSLTTILSMPAGSIATRRSKESNWEISRIL